MKIHPFRFVRQYEPKRLAFVKERQLLFVGYVGSVDEGFKLTCKLKDKFSVITNATFNILVYIERKIELMFVKRAISHFVTDL